MANWTCACGLTHAIIPGKPIRCVGRGHSVYISPAYFDPTYVKKKEPPKKVEGEYVPKTNREGETLNLF